jgi:hypothetical protein
MNPETYAEKLSQTFTAFQTSKSLPDNFCSYVQFVESIPAETLTPEVLVQVKSYFSDINQRIEQYDEQYQLLLRELGVVCSEPSKHTIPETFFRALLDFLRLAFSIYETRPEKLEVFFPTLKGLDTLFRTGNFGFEGDLLSKALLLQLTKSAWVSSNQSQPINKVAKHLGGARKNKTRKNRHKSNGV